MIKICIVLKKTDSAFVPECFSHNELRKIKNDNTNGITAKIRLILIQVKIFSKKTELITDFHLLYFTLTTKTVFDSENYNFFLTYFNPIFASASFKTVSLIRK